MGQRSWYNESLKCSSSLEAPLLCFIIQGSFFALIRAASVPGTSRKAAGTSISQETYNNTIFPNS